MNRNILVEKIYIMSSLEYLAILDYLFDIINITD